MDAILRKHDLGAKKIKEIYQLKIRQSKEHEYIFEGRLEKKKKKKKKKKNMHCTRKLILAK